MHQSLHHVAKLEKLLLGVLDALKADGILYLDEYVGPSRTFWDDENVAPYAARYVSFAREVRRWDALPPPIQPDDPTEAIRSGEILDQLAVGFETEEFRGYGGAILSIIGPGLNIDDAPPETLAELIESDRLVRPDFYAVIVARPKRGAGRELARVRYFIEPKVKRIGREVRDLLLLRRLRRRDTSAASTTPDPPKT
jgi:SAM-dependent methyltransferase